MSTIILDDLCERLQLTEVLRLAGPRADSAATAQQPYTAYLADLLQAEVDARQQRYVSSRVQMAHLPFRKPLDTFDFAFQPSIDERQIRELASLQWIDAAANVLFLGPPGVGKSHLTVSLALQAIQARQSVYFVTIQDMIADLRRAWGRQSVPRPIGGVYPSEIALRG